MELIDDKAFLRLNIYILAIKYLKERVFFFTKITGDNKKINKDGGEAKTVSNLEEKLKKTLHKKKRDTQTLFLIAAYLFVSAIPMPGLFAPPSVSVSALSVLILGSAPLPTTTVSVSVLGFVPPSASLFTVFMPVPGSAALLSAFGVSMPVSGSFTPPSVLSMSGMSIPMHGLSAPPSILSVSGISVLVSRSLALLSTSDIFVLVPRSLAFLFMMSLFGISMLVPGSSALLSPFVVFVLGPESSLLLFLTWSSPQTPMPVPGKQRLD